MKTKLRAVLAGYRDSEHRIVIETIVAVVGLFVALTVIFAVAFSDGGRDDAVRASLAECGIEVPEGVNPRLAGKFTAVYDDRLHRFEMVDLGDEYVVAFADDSDIICRFSID